MVDWRVATLTGSETVVSEAAFEEFRENLRGQLIKPSDQDYDDARTIWNATIDKRPALIARCAGVADVINSVNFARANNLLVAVRGGGHNVAEDAELFEACWHHGRRYGPGNIRRRSAQDKR